MELLRLRVCRRGVDSKKSRSLVTVIPRARDSLKTVRFVMFVQGKSVTTPTRLKPRKVEGSPPNTAL
jgi:hypothetical protein